MAAAGGEEVFEISDFTCASPWESFIADLEAVLRGWGLGNQTAPAAPTDALVWCGDREFRLSLHGKDAPVKNEQASRSLPAYMDDMMDPSRDFASAPHSVENWFGVSRYLLLASTGDAFAWRTAVPMLLGSLSLATAHVGCALPVFVQLSDAGSRGPLVFGTCAAPHPAGNGSVHTDFECVRLPSVPRSCSHLAGLVDVFRAKLGEALAPTDGASRTVAVSVRYTYFGLHDPFADGFGRDTATAAGQLPPMAMPGAARVARERRHALHPLAAGEPELNWGLRGDPVGEMHLCVVWPSFAEDAIVDNAVYSELDPLAAPRWVLRVLPANPQPTGRLADAVGRFVACCACDVDFHSLRVNADRSALSAAAAAMSASASPVRRQAEGGAAGGKDALRALTDPSSRIIPKVVGRSVSALSSSVGAVTQLVTSSVDRAISSLVDGEGEVPEMEDVEAVFATLFCDPSQPSGAESARWDALARRLKAAPADSLTHVLAAYLCRIGRRHGGMRGVALFWTEFVREVRWHWDTLTLLPRMGATADAPPPQPDMAFGLFHQKLQMLNCCIRGKSQREAARTSRSNSGAGGTPASPRSPGGDDDDNDVFFEAAQDESEWGDWPAEGAEGATAAQGGVPEGAVAAHDTLRILGSGEALRVPATQEPGPMTEDMVRDQAEVFSRLASTGDGAAIRARMQAASLLSDMEAFKAANPTAGLADFVRWHSPRDWVVSADDPSPCTGEDGVLSTRMSNPGNLWAEVWSQARPVPASRQRPLFDFTREAEKVLHYLENLSVGALHRLLLPSVVLAAFRTLDAADALQQTQLREREKAARARAGRTSVSGRAILGAMDLVVAALESGDEHAPFNALAPLSECESLLGAQASLGDRLSGQTRLVDALLEHDEAEVKTAAEREAVALVFARGPSPVARPLPGDGDKRAAHEGDFGPADVREYVLRATGPRPAASSLAVGHRMYCSVMPSGEFRLAGAVSHDGLFR